MKKILFGLLLFFAFISPVIAQTNDIQPDAVNVNQFVDNTTTSYSTITGEHVKSFDSNIIINRDGTADVKETIVYDFGDNEKHGIYRTIPTIKTNIDGKTFQLDFSNISVTDENNSSYNFSQTINNQQLKIKIGDANRLIYGIHTYVIFYKVSGNVTYFSDHDEFYWNINGNEWTVPTQYITSEVMFPVGIKKEDVKMVCYTGAYGSRKSACTSELQSWNDRTKMVTKANQALLASEGVSVDVSFPKNIVAVLEPKPYVPFEESLLGKVVMLLMGLIGLIWYFLLPVYIIYRWIRYGRDPKSTVGITTAWFDPPKTQDESRFLTPGEVGALGDETVDMKDISATIVDLARRGYLIIDERKKEDFWLVRQDKPRSTAAVVQALLDYEKLLLDKFFDGEDEIRIKDQELATEVAEVKNKIYDQVVEDKLFDKNPETTRTGYYVLAGIALFTSNFFLAIVAFLFGRVMPKKTIYGVEAKNVAFSLKNFLSSQKRQLEFQADKQLMFERLLPFAIAFGVEKIWAKRFENLNLTQPNWYRSYSSTNFSSYMLINSLSSSMKSFQTAATPTRSTSGFSSGMGGGGFSGGGGGGGGGGSW